MKTRYLELFSRDSGNVCFAIFVDVPNLKTRLLYFFLGGGEVGIARLHRKIEDDPSRFESPGYVAWERG